MGDADGGPGPGRPVTPAAVPYDENGKPRPSWKKKADLESDIAAAEKDCEEPKSEEQARAGNYRHGHVKLHGLDITLETAKGMTRRGKDKSGTPWEIKMQHSYGYVKRTKSEADEDHFDVFLGDHPESELVFVVDQYLGDSFDEHKGIIGCLTKEEAKQTYLANYCDGWKGCGDITSLTMPQFKEWVRTGDTASPLAGQKLKFEQHAQPHALSFYTRDSLRAVVRRKAASVKVASPLGALAGGVLSQAIPRIAAGPLRASVQPQLNIKQLPGAPPQEHSPLWDDVDSFHLRPNYPGMDSVRAMQSRIPAGGVEVNMNEPIGGQLMKLPVQPKPFQAPTPQAQPAGKMFQPPRSNVRNTFGGVGQVYGK